MNKRPNPIYVFTHIPKTAGTAFLQALMVPNLNVMKFPGMLTAIAKINKAEEIECITQHSPYGIHLFCRQKVIYITMLRDPVERAISYYFFIRNSSREGYRHPMADYAEKHSLLEFCALRKFRNVQTRFMAGILFDRCYPILRSKFVDKLMLRQALYHMRATYGFVGIKEKFDESVDRLAKILNFKKNRAKKYYKPSGKPPMDRFSSLELSKIREYNYLDVELYASAVKLFNGGGYGVF
ncbi:MAG: hypothetical protein GF392_02580 [Candidatus Omnitrophica bacterium]|nr:hypothetical protein [Candidatus Omnitrophota bacterium]